MTEHKIIQDRWKGLNTSHHLSRGSKKRLKSRGLRRGKGNLGRFSKGPLSKWKRTGAKTSKKISFKFTCQICKKTKLSSKGIRAKKLEQE